MNRRLGYLVVACSLALPSWGADKPASIAGYVRNASGAPQIGAVVEVMGSAAQVLNLVTDENLRARVAERTDGVRNVILALAFGSLAAQQDAG